MKIIILLIAISLLVALGFLAAFFWAVKDGQYDDEYTPSVRILFEDKKEGATANSTSIPPSGGKL
jgi:cbb3-type cytochrome oxidase maturation protein